MATASSLLILDIKKLQQHRKKALDEDDPLNETWDTLVYKKFGEYLDAMARETHEEAKELLVVAGEWQDVEDESVTIPSAEEDLEHGDEDIPQNMVLF